MLGGRMSTMAGGRVASGIDKMVSTGTRQRIASEVVGLGIGEGTDLAGSQIFGYDYEFDPVNAGLSTAMSVGGSYASDAVLPRVRPKYKPYNVYKEGAGDMGGWRASDRGSLKVLMEVDGIGDTLGLRILGTRNQAGGGRLSYDQLLDIKGIGPDKAMAIMDARVN